MKVEEEMDGIKKTGEKIIRRDEGQRTVTKREKRNHRGTRKRGRREEERALSVLPKFLQQSQKASP